MQILNYIGRIKENELLQFFLCNAIFSGSTFLFNLLFPILFNQELFGEVVYMFQMVIFLNTITGFGLAITLLRNHSIEGNRSYLNYYLAISLITLGLLCLGFLQDNPVSRYIKVNDLGSIEHLLFYLSVIFSNLFLFNRSFLNSKKRFDYMLLNVSIISVVRLIGLVYISSITSADILKVLLVLFIIPFLYEGFFFIQQLARYWNSGVKFKFQDFFKFINFSLKVFLAGAIFVAADRLFLLRLKEVDSQFTDILSFAYGFMGIISILNMSFSNYFLGKIVPSNNEEIILFQQKIRKYIWKFTIFVCLISAIIGTLIFWLYPELGWIAPIVLVILIVKTAVISFLGLTNLLTKTLNLVRYDLLVNIMRYALVFLVIHLSKQWHFLSTLIVVSMVMVLGEFILTTLVKIKIQRVLA